jgi:hypothetical protein
MGIHEFEVEPVQKAPVPYLRRKPLADDDRAQVEDDHQGDEEQGGGEDHRLGGLGIGRLKPEIVDVETEVHELLVEVQEG